MRKSRSTKQNAVQIGFETTAGTAVPCTKILTGLSLEMSPDVPITLVNADGAKGAVGVQRGKEHTPGTFKGALDYNLITYLKTLMYGDPVLTTDGAVDIRTWNPSAVEGITPRPATIERGSAGGAERVAYGLVSGMTIKWDAKTAEIEAAMFGAKYDPNITLTPGLSEVLTKPVNPTSIGVYVSLNGTDWTLLEDTKEGEYRMQGLWGPDFVVRDDSDTYDRIVEKAPDFGLMLSVDDGSECDDMLSRMYLGTKFWLGFKAVGEEISSGKYHEIKDYMPVFCTKPDFKDRDSVFGSTYMFGLAHDASYGMTHMTVKNNLASL